MPQNTNLNRSPYYDDFDAGKNFYRVLFRPGYSIQARELTQLQSMLQDQVEQVGNSMFKQGQMVIPGEVSFTDKYEYVKLSSISQVAQNVNNEINFVKYDIAQLMGLVLVGQTSGVKAIVDNYAYETSTDADTIYVKYVSSGADNIDTKFRQGEALKLETPTTSNDPTLVCGTDGIKPSNTPALGMGSAVNVQKGIYFINGHFVQNDEQTLILDKYGQNPSYKVGWTITETIITPEDDISLKDNAQGYSNFSAPGAHRLKISLALEKFATDTPSNKNFVQLVYLQQGKIQRQIKQTPASQIEEILARRTYDESGDYVVNEFTPDLKDYYNADGSGFYTADADNLVNGLSILEARNKMVLGIGPGKAYIRGYEVENQESKYIELDKALSTQTRFDTRLYATSLTRLGIRSVQSSVPISATLDGESTPFKKINLYRKFIDGYLGTNGVLSGPVTAKSFFACSELRGVPYDNNIGLMTVYVYPGKDTTRGDSIDVTATSPTDIVLSQLKDGNKKTLYVYNGSSYVEVDVVAARFNLSYQTDGTNPNLAWLAETGSGGMNENSGGNPTHVVHEFILRGPIDNLQKIHASYQSHGPQKVGESATDGLTLFAVSNGSGEYGEIIDYTMPVTPIIGRAISRDFRFRSLPQGFDKTKNVIASSTMQDATFDIAYTSPILFTKLKLTGNHLFETGSNIQGSISGATGVVEGGLSVGQNDPENCTLSHSNTLTLSGVIGQFVEGEEIFDMDNSEKAAVIAISGRISHFTVPYGGAEYSDGCLLKIGDRTYQSNYVVVSKEGTSNIGINEQNAYIHKVQLTELGRRELIELYESPPDCEVVDDGGVHSSNDPDAYVRAVLFTNTIQNFGTEDLRSIGMQHGNLNKTFTADVQYADTQYASYKTLSNGLAYSGKTDADYVEATNYSARPADELKEDDLIQITADGKTYKYEVYKACNPTTSRTGRIYLKQRLIVGFLSNTLSKINALIENAGKSSLILPLPNSKIKSVVKEDDDSGIKYYARRQFIENVTVSGTDNTVTFSANLDFGQQEFAPFNRQDYILEVYSSGATTTRYGSATGEIVKDGDLLYIDESMVQIQNSASTNNAGAISIVLPEDYFVQSGSLNLSDLKLKLSVTIKTSKAKPKLKTAVKNKRISLTGDIDNEIIPLRGDDYDNPTGQVKSFSDVYKLRYIYEGAPGIAPTVDENGNILGDTGTNITDHFLFDDGQRDNLYDTASIVRKPGFATPQGTLVIGFDHFSHSEGDFFTVDSYLHEAGVTFDEIPQFTSLVYGKKSLGDVVDFRPLVGTSASIPGYLNASVMDTNSNVSEVFTAGGVSAALPAEAAASSLPYTFECTYSYYVDRIDIVYLKKDGTFFVKKGAGSNDPQSAQSSDEALKVYKLYIPAYTDNLKKVKVYPVENKRFTMRDIGKLQTRIERLERYTMLSVLEQSALNTQIKDSLTGIEKFKSGFVVDNFENFALSNLQSVDFKAALDLTRGTLRPESKETTIELVEKDPSPTARALSNYVVNHGMVTLPYTEKVFAQNTFATETVAVNPFLVFKYKGEATISPNYDCWYDEDQTPAVNNNDNQTLDTLEVNSEDGDKAMSQIHDISKTAATGNETEFSNTSSLSSDAPNNSESEVTGASTTSSSNIASQNSEVAVGETSTTKNGKTVSTSMTLYAKEQYLNIHIRRMKPDTKLYVFIDGQAAQNYFVPDRSYSGEVGSSLRNFGDDLITDDSGNATGILLFPGGRRPTKGTGYEEVIDDLTFDTEKGLRFTVGDKKITFTSDKNNGKDAESVATKTFKVSAIKKEAPNDIIATEDVDSEDKTDGIQHTENILNPDVAVADPLAQTFRVESFDGGIFLSSLDLYFSEKDAKLPITVKVTDTIAGRPTKNIIPGSTVVVDPITYLRVITSGEHNLKKDEIIEGDTSNAQGPLIGVLDSQNTPVAAVNNEFTLATNQVYTLMLGDHNKETFIAGEPLVITSLTVANNARSGDSIVKMNIVLDSGYVSHIVMNDLGDGYPGSTTVTIESPQLPGGVTATAAPQITDTKVYEILPSLGGSEYTTAPAVLITGTGATQLANATAVVKYTKPAVRMGAATNAKALIPTKFNFQYPVYLENDREYALVIETNSTKYKTFVSKLGETEINSNSTVTTQPLIGSLFKSQNSDLWTANQYEDLKFDLYQAQFTANKTGVINLINTDMGYGKLQSNPIQTNSEGSNSTTSNLYGANQKIVKISHKNHGLNPGSFVALKDVASVGGYAIGALNRQILPVIDVGIDFYTVAMSTNAGGTTIGGGYNGKALGQIKYEKANIKVDSLDFADTSLETQITTTAIKAVDARDNVVDYTPEVPVDIIFNKEYFFPTQRVVASKLNEKMFATRMNNNSSMNIAATLSTTNANLSPIINIKNPKAILTTNRVESAKGDEPRYGKLTQEVELYKTVVLNFTDSNASPVAIGNTIALEATGGIGQVVTGKTSKTKGVISFWDAGASTGKLYVRIIEGDGFLIGEEPVFSGSSTYNDDFNGSGAGTGNAAGLTLPLKVSGTLSLAQFDITSGDNLANNLDTKTGQVTRWNQENYRMLLTSNASSFNVGDVIGAGAVAGGAYQSGFDLTNESYKVPMQIKAVYDSYGVLYTPDRLKNASNIATYVTKEISLDNPGNGISVKIAAALQEIDDIAVMYKIKRASQQIFFSEINWNYFNEYGESDVVVTPTTGTNFSPTTEDSSDFKEYSFTVDNLNEFSSFAIKIVMRSRNPAMPPRIRDIRAIATI